MKKYILPPHLLFLMPVLLLSACASSILCPPPSPIGGLYSKTERARAVAKREVQQREGVEIVGTWGGGAIRDDGCSYVMAFCTRPGKGNEEGKPVAVSVKIDWRNWQVVEYNIVPPVKPSVEKPKKQKSS